MNIIEVSAGVFIQNHKILLAQRSICDELSLQWEFPGGKLEKGEDLESCMIRELYEEFGVQVKIKASLGSITHDYGNKIIRLNAFHVDFVSGTIENRVHQNIAWFEPEHLANQNLAAADRKLLEIVMDYLAKS